MRKKFFTGLVVFTMLVWLVPFYLLAGTQEAVEYLKGQSLDDWSAQSLVAAGEQVSNLSFLDGFSPSSATDLEKRIMTLVALNKDPKSFYPGRDLVSELKTNFYQSKQLGEVNLLNDDIFGVLALAAAGETSNLVFSDSVDFIVANQNSDGGWSYAVGSESDSNDTAIAIMSLLEAGYDSDDTVVSQAVNYLTNSQNSDGGWSFMSGSESDSASTAWVIAALNKANQTVPQNAYDFLNSLQTSNGSFKWLASDSEGSAYMTSQALLALTNSYFPVKKMTSSVPLGNYLRIEGSNTNVCEGYFVAGTALELIEIASQTCGYTYEIEDTSFGPYLKKINSDEAQGNDGWMYRVNWEMPTVGAGDYQLQTGDEVLWYFGAWDNVVTKMNASTKVADIGKDVLLEVVYYNESSVWQPLAEATITAGNDQYVTDSEGRVSINFSDASLYKLQAEKDGYVRSNLVKVLVGQGSTDSVGWEVNISDVTAGPTVSFQVVTENINFGTANLGDTVSGEIEIKNDGSVPVYLEAVVMGDSSLINRFSLDSVNWSDYNQVLASGLTDTINANLTIPADFVGGNKQTGEILFWGTIAD